MNGSEEVFIPILFSDKDEAHSMKKYLSELSNKKIDAKSIIYEVEEYDDYEEEEETEILKKKMDNEVRKLRKMKKHLY